MWIKKSVWKLEKEYRKSQEDLIKDLKELIKKLKEIRQIHESYIEKLESHYNELNKICKDTIENNGSMIKYIRTLELKNKALQASLDEAVKILNKKSGDKNNES